MESLSIAQSIFVVFFAIFWGAIFGVQGRWRMFQPILRFAHIRHRLLLSALLANVLPLLFFLYAFYCLKDGALTTAQSGPWAISRVVLAGVLPSFAIFGFYRLWMGIVELIPEVFYEHQNLQRPCLKDIDPTIEELHLNHRHQGWNLLLAIIYFAIAGVGLAIA